MLGQVPASVSRCGCMFCAVHHREGQVSRYLAFPIKCNSWDCPDCRRIKARKYRQRMGRIFDGRGLWFYTLTYRHFISPDLAWATYNQAWNRLRTNLVKQFGHFEFVRVLESHKQSPYPHVHLIADKNFPMTIFGPAAVHAGFGWQLSKKTVDNEDAGSYISKYLTKEWTNDESANLRRVYRCRIISFSRGLLSPVRKTHAWDMLLRGADLAACIDHIRMDYQWNTREIPDATEIDAGGCFEVHVVWTDRPPIVDSGALDQDWRPSRGRLHLGRWVIDPDSGGPGRPPHPNPAAHNNFM